MAELPTGTVTFLFTDIEGSTTRWEQHREAMQAALARHDALLRQAIEGHGGVVFKTVGDAFYAAFNTAPDALSAALEAQRALHAEAWDEQLGAVRVRMALHTGMAEQREGDYFGPPLNRVARLLSAGHGGQILLSRTTQELVRDHVPPGTELRNLGEYRLKDLIRSEHIFQLASAGLPADFPPLKSLDTFPTNLPVQLTSFVGREHELAEVKRLLGTTHLLTLIGPGGTGKTRLSLEAGAGVLDHVADGVWLVELAPLADPALVTQSVAVTLGIREQPERPWLDVLIDYLRYKQLILILDNCEHLIEACAHLADRLLRACPKLQILASSREALGIAGETVFRVPSLPVPDPQHLPPVEELAHYESVRLFVDRAQNALPDFRLTGTNASAVAQLCQRLDGIPLAIELAAARVKVLTAEQLATRLDDRFRLLTGGSRTALPRQQTLRALIDWSWELLSEPERILLRRLSVFAGGWTLEAAEVVAGDAAQESGREGAGPHVLAAADVLELLIQLVNKSLVVAESDQGAEARYRLLETIRQYARDKLLEAGEAADVRDRHLRYFLTYAEAAEPQLQGPEMVAWLDRLELEHDNLRAALGWSLERDPDLALRLAGASFDFWARRTYTTEASRWLREALERGETLSPVDGEAARTRMAARGKVLAGLGQTAIWQGDHTAARSMLEQSVALARKMGDPQALARDLGLLGLAAVFQGDVPAALAAAEECEALCRQHGYKWDLAKAGSILTVLAVHVRGDMAEGRAYLEENVRLARELGNPWLSAMSLFGLGTTAAVRGDGVEARARLEESTALFLEMKDRYFVNVTRSELAHTLRRQGNYAEAVRLYHETICRWLELGNRAAVAHQLESLAFIAVARGHARRAARLLGTGEAIREAMHVAMTAAEREEYEWAVADVRARLDETTLAGAWQEGREMTLEQAIAYALEVAPAEPAA